MWKVRTMALPFSGNFQVMAKDKKGSSAILVMLARLKDLKCLFKKKIFIFYKIIIVFLMFFD